MMETKISGFHTSFYIPAIQKLVFHLPHVRILGKITVLQYDAHPSNNVNYFKMFYVVVIMLRCYFQDFLIKYNQNTMIEIDQCL